MLAGTSPPVALTVTPGNPSRAHPRGLQLRSITCPDSSTSLSGPRKFTLSVPLTLTVFSFLHFPPPTTQNFLGACTRWRPFFTFTLYAPKRFVVVEALVAPLIPIGTFFIAPPSLSVVLPMMRALPSNVAVALRTL